jgi:hypothetical protein
MDKTKVQAKYTTVGLVSPSKDFGFKMVFCFLKCRNL